MKFVTLATAADCYDCNSLAKSLLYESLQRESEAYLSTRTTYYIPSTGNRVATASEKDGAATGAIRKQSSRDPMSHRHLFKLVFSAKFMRLEEHRHSSIM